MHPGIRSRMPGCSLHKKDIYTPPKGVYIIFLEHIGICKGDENEKSGKNREGEKIAG